MLSQFNNSIQELSLINEDERILLAVSGGIDSVIMTQLFHTLGKYEFGIAHCNFRLRGADSEADEEFVRQLATTLNCSFYSTGFDTDSHASRHSISIQMAARDLRYAWFNEIASEHKFDKIAVAHNQDDLVETVLLNLVRGTGIKGLTGMRAKSKNIIRPLLFATREEIVQFAQSNKIEFREDKSNSDTKYKRNFVRHEVIPLLKKINPSLNTTIAEEAEIFESVHKLYAGELASLREKLMPDQGARIRISISKLKSLGISPPLLFDLLSEFNFSYSTIKNVFDALDGESGKEFLSDRYILLKDRNELFIEKRRMENRDEAILIRSSDIVLESPLQLAVYSINKSNLTLPRNNTKVAIDEDRINFPLKLRRWQTGDYFIPLGMQGRKKLSDFFVDRKIDRLTKENAWVLTSNEEIVWVVGYQIDDRFKITEETNRALILELKN